MIAGITLMLCLAPVTAQSNSASVIATLGVVDGQPTACCNKSAAVTDSYDPLIPQLFAVDAKNNVFAAINTVKNTVDVLTPSNGELLRDTSKIYLVDATYKRHDEYRIYRPKSVAIYEGYIVVLASNRDSCFLAVLDFNAKQIKKQIFAGAANAFSYSYAAKTLYISGESQFGYDFIALNAQNGIDHIDLKDAAAVHYVKPKMSEVIAVKDPYGIGLTVIAMVVVFLALLMLFLIFKQVGNILVARLKKKEGKHEEKQGVPSTVVSGDTHGAVYAAIATAIYLYNEELHDEEAAVLTINKVSRTYSPWSSKIHGMNSYFNNR
jgi:Na+-transporting methylmalonyl-CoA/oxaloacetate decarboxylase gamma subunit